MIELLDPERCVSCDKCVKVCPTDVFDLGADGVPVIARQSDCQTCFQCEANCPTDALYVAPHTTPLPPGSPEHDVAHLVETGLLGSYRAHLGWGRGRTPGAALAVGPSLTPSGPRLIS
ncbi:ferredoxin family protein [Actinokineospora auranticolor]|uniref:NAD-dependent dihydropyrimidine dehydrogenase PreA subunit n=1 Tax=Actinokineospora auranticolor TaxID=155976 RepID=A0A2S6GII5_9PSEU|nr:ferredoxin family protein [Actinokineospora auranticolor]PPK65029.1 NAD-dependent dihydropyrimidine dehydrogenase PreA subunit [Actinokineospora auranticolor]